MRWGRTFGFAGALCATILAAGGALGQGMVEVMPPKGPAPTGPAPPPAPAPAPPSPSPSPTPAPTPTPAATPTATAPTPAPCPDGCVRAEDKNWGDRTMKGHTFIYPTTQQSAFVTTYFGIRQGVVYYKLPDVPLGNAGTRSFAFVGAAENADLGVRITDWIGAYGSLSASALAGVNLEAALFRGGTYMIGGEVGAVGRIARIESTGTQIAARLSYGAASGNTVRLLPLIAALKAAPAATVKDILEGDIGKYLIVENKTSAVGGSVHAAQTIVPHFSVQAAVGVRQQTDKAHFFTAAGYKDATAKATKVTGGLAATIDGSPSGVPVAGVVEWSIEAGKEKNDFTGKTESVSPQFLVGGLYYSGRPNLQLGFAVGALVNQKTEEGEDASGVAAKSGKPTTTFGQFILRYVW